MALVAHCLSGGWSVFAAGQYCHASFGFRADHDTSSEVARAERYLRSGLAASPLDPLLVRDATGCNPWPLSPPLMRSASASRSQRFLTRRA